MNSKLSIFEHLTQKSPLKIIVFVLRIPTGKVNSKTSKLRKVKKQTPKPQNLKTSQPSKPQYIKASKKQDLKPPLSQITIVVIDREPIKFAFRPFFEEL